MTSTTQDARQQALTTLELPDINGLSEAQVRGVTCVWDGIALTPETAVDLGPRPRDGGPDWFPRGCKRCTGEAAHRLLLAHAPRCDVYPSCPTAVAAQRLMREAGL